MIIMDLHWHIVPRLLRPLGFPLHGPPITRGHVSPYRLTPSTGPPNCPKPASLFAPCAVQLIGAQVRCKRRSCTTRKPCPECALSAHLEACGPPRSARPATSKEPSCSEIEVIVRDFESGLGVFADDGAFAFGSRRDIELGASDSLRSLRGVGDDAAYGR